MSVGGWYHCSVKPVSRGAGRSAVAAAAYRCGERLHDVQTDQTHDYRHRSGVEMAFIAAPEDAPEWAHDWGQLWNAAEAAETRRNGQTAREIELALPASVGAKEREAMAREFAAHLVARYGVTVAVALHAPPRHGDGRNHHAHFLMTTRRMEAGGLGAKTRVLDDRKTGPQEVRYLREYAAALINRHLADAGSAERVDHRSHKERGLEHLPTQHLGVHAAAMERQGRETRRGDLNRAVLAGNQRIEGLARARAAVDAEIEQTRRRLRGSVFAEPSLQQHKAQLHAHGAIVHRGLPGPWQEQAAIRAGREEQPGRWAQRVLYRDQGQSIER